MLERKEFFEKFPDIIIQYLVKDTLSLELSSRIGRHFQNGKIMAFNRQFVLQLRLILSNHYRTKMEIQTGLLIMNNFVSLTQSFSC